MRTLLSEGMKACFFFKIFCAFMKMITQDGSFKDIFQNIPVSDYFSMLLSIAGGSRPPSPSKVFAFLYDLKYKD